MNVDFFGAIPAGAVALIGAALVLALSALLWEMRRVRGSGQTILLTIVLTRVSRGAHLIPVPVRRSRGCGNPLASRAPPLSFRGRTIRPDLMAEGSHPRDDFPGLR